MHHLVQSPCFHCTSIWFEAIYPCRTQLWNFCISSGINSPHRCSITWRSTRAGLGSILFILSGLVFQLECQPHLFLQVRDESVSTLSLIYSYCGRGLRDYLHGHNGIRSVHLKTIDAAFDKTVLKPEQIPLPNMGTGMGTAVTSPSPRSRSMRSSPSDHHRPVHADEGEDDAFVAMSGPCPVITIHSEKEFEHEIDAISIALRDVNGVGWQERVDALRRLVGIVKGPAQRLPSLMTQLKKLVAPLITQVCHRIVI